MSQFGNEMGENVNQVDIDNIVELLDQFAASGEGRMKLKVAEEGTPEKVEKKYHHGRCDVGSPWANGMAWDVIEDVTPPKNR